MNGITNTENIPCCKKRDTGAIGARDRTEKYHYSEKRVNRYLSDNMQIGYLESEIPDTNSSFLGNTRQKTYLPIIFKKGEGGRGSLL
jgi:hypothetical protein